MNTKIKEVDAAQDAAFQVHMQQVSEEVLAFDKKIEAVAQHKESVFRAAYDAEKRCMRSQARRKY